MLVLFEFFSLLLLLKNFEKCDIFHSTLCVFCGDASHSSPEIQKASILVFKFAIKQYIEVSVS